MSNMKVIVTRKQAEKLSEENKIIFYDKFGNKYKCSPKSKIWQISENFGGEYQWWDYCGESNIPKQFYTMSMADMAKRLQSLEVEAL
jgi:hypothetical protein